MTNSQYANMRRTTLNKVRQEIIISIHFIEMNNAHIDCTILQFSKHRYEI